MLWRIEKVIRFHTLAKDTLDKKVTGIDCLLELRTADSLCLLTPL